MINFIANPNLRTLLQVDTLLILGLMLMSHYTSLLRLSRKVYANPEDYAQARLAIPSATAAELGDPIARSRRMHLNHLENVLPFLVLSTLYALTEPDHTLFARLLWAFFGVRVLYTAFYVRRMQPYRTIAYTVGVLLQSALAILTLAATLGCRI